MSKLLPLSLLSGAAVFAATIIFTALTFAETPVDEMFLLGSNGVYNRGRPLPDHLEPFLPVFGVTLTPPSQDPTDVPTSLNAELFLSRDNRYYLNGLDQGTYFLTSELHPLTSCPYSTAICENLTDISEELRVYLNFREGDWGGERVRLNRSNDLVQLSGRFEKHERVESVFGVTRTAVPPESLPQLKP